MKRLIRKETYWMMPPPKGHEAYLMEVAVNHKIAYKPECTCGWAGVAFWKPYQAATGAIAHFAYVEPEWNPFKIHQS